MARRSQELGRWSDPGVLVLASLAGGEKHGYAIVSDIEAIAGVHLGPGTLYGALARLEEQRLIEALPASGRRRPYRITAAGSSALRQQLATISAVAAAGLARLGPTGAAAPAGAPL